MDKIEQAREALAAKGREVGFLSIEDIDEVFASLSTSTPVDGVEPVAQLIKGLRHAASARSDRLQQTQAIDNAIAFLSALASPEAEARLRERVAYFTDDKWGGYWQTVVDGKPYNFRTTLEARLAQAEGGPAVTEALKPFLAFARLPSFHKLPDDYRVTMGSPRAAPQLTVGDFKRLLAALHPQSAAGEEGKP